MSAATAKASNRVNGLDLNALFAVIEEIKQDPAKGRVAFRVKAENKRR